MKLQVKQPTSQGELTVSSQKEFLQLYNRGIITPDDLVLRGEKWVPAGQLPWIAGMAVENKKDNRQLLWITIGTLILGLIGALWIQNHSGAVARKTGALPPGADHALPPAR